MKIIPIIMIRNEEIWIQRIIQPLVNVFGNVIVADTGSTDDTIAQAYAIPGVHLMTYQNLDAKEIGLCREWMQREAKDLYNATHVFLVDGDELYPTSYLRYIADNPMPDNALAGFTYGIECTELDNSECWLLGTENGLTGVSRHAIFSVDSKWYGVHPFESPDSFIAGNSTNHYFPSDDKSMHFYHIHQMKRSNKDEDVMLRMQKKYQFSMRNAPEIKPLVKWLNNQKEYKDD